MESPVSEYTSNFAAILFQPARLCRIVNVTVDVSVQFDVMCSA